MASKPDRLPGSFATQFFDEFSLKREKKNFVHDLHGIARHTTVYDFIGV
jgi:hypothetical protein